PRVAAGTARQVTAIDRRCLDRDAHLPRSGNRIRHRLVPQHTLVTELMDSYCMHDKPSFPQGSGPAFLFFLLPKRREGKMVRVGPITEGAGGSRQPWTRTLDDARKVDAGRKRPEGQAVVAIEP